MIKTMNDMTTAAFDIASARRMTPATTDDQIRHAIDAYLDCPPIDPHLKKRLMVRVRQIADGDYRR